MLDAMQEIQIAVAKADIFICGIPEMLKTAVLWIFRALPIVTILIGVGWLIAERVKRRKTKRRKTKRRKTKRRKTKRR